QSGHQRESQSAPQMLVRMRGLMVRGFISRQVGNKSRYHGAGTMTEQSFDPLRFKNEQRRDWDVAAAGWKKWWPVFERAAQHVSDRLVELAGIKAGARVLDVATGNGEPALTAARRAGAGGRVIATDQSDG